MNPCISNEGGYRRVGFVLAAIASVMLLASSAAAQDIAIAAGMEVDTDRRGSDFRNFNLPQADPSLCREACRETSGCVAWTFVRPGLQGPTARCWLKHAVPAPQPNSCCVSGVMGQDAPDTARGMDVLAGSAQPSAAVRAEHGMPDVFTKMVIAADDGSPLTIEIWEYPDQGLAHWVVDGIPQDLVRIPSAPGGRPRAKTHDPKDYPLGMSRTSAMQMLGLHATEEDDTVSSDGIVLEFENGALVYVDTGAQGSEGGS